MRAAVEELVRRSNAAAGKAKSMGARSYAGAAVVPCDSSPHSVWKPLCDLLDPDMPEKVANHMESIGREKA